MSECATCLDGDCGLTDDINLYSLESPLFPFVLNCPPGNNCNNAFNVRLVCGSELITITIPTSATTAQRRALIAAALDQCARKKIFDDNGPNNGEEPTFGSPDTPFVIDPDGAPVNIYLSRSLTCTKYCSQTVSIVDGQPVVTKTSPFTYTLPAGSMLGFTQLQANEFAMIRACQLAQEHLFCLSDLTGAFCADDTFSETIRATGRYISRAPFSDFWELSSGTLPPGLTFNGGFITGGRATITGTPTTPGLYSFTISVTLRTPAASGDRMSKTYTLAIAEISTESPLPAPEVGVPYLENLSLEPSHDQETETWSIQEGVLPDGLELTDNGIIQGTPTETGEFPVTIQVTAKVNDEEITCSKNFTFGECAVPEDYSYSCPPNSVPKVYTPANDYFVAFNDEIERAMISGSAGEVDIVDFTQAVPALDFTIQLDTTGRVLGGIYDPNNEIMVFCRWADILSSQPTISFVANDGTVLSEITLSGYQAGFKNNPYFTLLTRGTKYVVLWLNSFAVGNKNSLLLIDTENQSIAVQRDISGVQYSNDAGPAFSCEENELILTYRFSGNSFLQKISAEDLTDVDTINMGTDSTLFPAYDPSTNQIIALRNPASTNWSVVYLNPVTGDLENSISMGYNGNLTAGAYNFKLLSYVIGGYDDGTVNYFDSLTHTAKCSVSFAGMTNPWLFATARSNGNVYVMDQGASKVWELVTT